MAQKIIRKANYDIIVETDEVDTIYQKIIEVREKSVKVISKNGKEYFVKLSDKAKTLTINEMDTAEIKTFKGCWLVTDVFPFVKEEVDDSDEELQRQLKMFHSLGGGY